MEKHVTYIFTEEEQAILKWCQVVREIREISNDLMVMAARNASDKGLPVRVVGEALGWSGSSVSRVNRGLSRPQ